MIIHRALAAAIVAVGAGAVVFLSSGQEAASPTTGSFGPVPVAIPPAVTEVPDVHPAVPAAERVAPSTTPVAPSPGKPAGRTAPKVANPQVAPRSAPRTVAPRAATAPATQQQPQPAGTEPNGTGGWQLPACYDETCVAQPEAYGPQQGTGTESLNSTLGLLGIVNTIPALIGGR